MILSQRGKQMFRDEFNFIYVLNGKTKDGTKLYWTCARKVTCKSRIHTVDGKVVFRSENHTHDADATKVSTKLLVNTMVSSLRNGNENTSNVIRDAIQGCSEDTLAALPNRRTLTRRIQRVRRRLRQAAQMKLHNEPQQLELEQSTTKQHESDHQISADELNIENNEWELQLSSIETTNEVPTIKLENLNENHPEPRIGGVDFTQKNCKVAFVDQTEYPIWESASEFEVKPEDLVRIFRELKNEQSINSGVIAVNGNLTDSERRDLVAYAMMLQFLVLRVVNDTTAILAANGCFNYVENRCVLILDINYRRFQMTALKVENEQPEILIKSTTDLFTEVQFDEAILKYCSEQFQNFTGLDLRTVDSPKAQKALQRLKENSLEAKQRLSVLDATIIDIGALYQDHDFNIKFSRMTCQIIVSEFFKEIPKYIVKSLTERNVQRQEITDIILIGDFAQFLDHMISECFYNAFVHKTEDSNAIVARGAAILAKAALENPIVEFNQFIEPIQPIIQ